MEERQPLDSRSLSHTSKEPEAQAWAQIGTVAVEQTEAKTDSVPLLDMNIDTVPFSSSNTEHGELSGTEKDDDANSDFQLHVDEDAEPFQVEDGIDTEDTDVNGGETEVGEATVEAKNSKKERERDDKSSRKSESDIDELARTNSLDPNKIRARVFVGQLNTDTVSKKEIEDAFGKYGKIEGISLQRGYGFVQFQNEDGAKKAIREMHGNTDLGSKIVVDKPVALKKLLGEKTGLPKPWPLDERDPQDRAIIDEWEYLRERDAREREIRDRYARLEELERLYYHRGDPALSARRDPYYERGYRSRPPPPPPPAPMGQMAAMDRYERMRFAELEHARGRYQERLPQPSHHPSSYYDRPRDDPYDRRPMRDFDRYEMPFSRRM